MYKFDKFGMNISKNSFMKMFQVFDHKEWYSVVCSGIAECMKRKTYRNFLDMKKKEEKKLKRLFEFVRLIVLPLASRTWKNTGVLFLLLNKFCSFLSQEPVIPL